MNTNLCYCFVSHNSVVSQDYDRIKKMMHELDYDNYFVFYSGDRHIENDHVVHINCDDTYCGLPEKINKICKYIKQHKKINFLAKLDRTMTIKKIINYYDLDGIDYAGKPLKFGNGKYHFNRCDRSSRWYNKEFCNERIFYCLGGTGYILSKKSINFIALDESYLDHIYEDYYVGHTLMKNKIRPHNFDIKTYFYDSCHPNLFR